MNRRELLKSAGFASLAGLVGAAPLEQALAQGQTSLAIAWNGDIPSWDPNLRTHVVGHSIFKAVFDQPLTQTPDLKIAPSLITKWSYPTPDYLTLELDFRDDVWFHNGDKFTAEDFRFSFHDRPKGTVALDTKGVWRRIQDIEVVSPTKALVRFSQPMPSAIPWFTFLASFVVPKKYMEQVGLDEFMKKPVGTGPFKLVEYQQGSRIVLEAFDRYWGTKSPFQRVTFEILRDVTARSGAIEARRVDLAVEIPVREANRLGQLPGLTNRVDPFTDIYVLQVSRTGAFEDERIRLAAHHAIDKAALSRAFFNNAAKPISVPAAHGTPGYPANFTFAFDTARAQALLREAGFGPDKPARMKFYTTRGLFPSDYEMAQAITQMWGRIGLQAELETIEFVTYQEGLRANKLPEATIYRWGNTTGDPEIYSGYLLNPKLQFSAWKSDDMGERIDKLFVENDMEKRFQGYRDLHVYAVQKGYSIPLLQGVTSVVHQANLKYQHYETGWVLPNLYTRA